jgi:hypothetical protein
MAAPPDGVSSVNVSCSMDIKALSEVVSNVSFVSWVESSLLVRLVSVSSHDSGSTFSESLTLLAGDNSVSVSIRSDSSSSFVEDEPLLVVSRVAILDSQSVLMSSNVLLDDESSTLSHS